MSSSKISTSFSDLDLDLKSLTKNAAYRFYIRARLKLSKRWRPSNGSVLFLSNRTCLKYGKGVQLSEAHTMHFISRCTSIPIPKVKCAFTHHDYTYIYMERIDGKDVCYVWDEYPGEFKTKILSQLRTMIDEMRRLPPPSDGKLANIDGGPLNDYRRAMSSSEFGPFTNIDDFHSYLRRSISFDPENDPEVNELIKGHNGSWRVVFTHGDLSSLNILVRNDKIVGIVDWEMAGYYPEYWEYVNAYMVNPYNEFWRDEVDKFLDCYPDELATEILRRKLYDEI